MSHARAVISPGVLAEVVSQPPLTLRRVRAAADIVGLCLVGSAAGPLEGDDLRLTVDVAAGARAELGAAGASIAQGGNSRMTTDVRVGAGAHLDADPGALVISAGARVAVALSLTLHATAGLVWRELVVLGRTGEAPGRATLRWDVTRGGTPLLRQHVDLADPALASWPGTMASCRVLLSELRIGPRVDAHTVVHGPTAVTHRLAPGATLTTVLAPSADAAHEMLAGQQAAPPRWAPTARGRDVRHRDEVGRQAPSAPRRPSCPPTTSPGATNNSWRPSADGGT